VAFPLKYLIFAFYPIVWLFERLTNAMKTGERRVGTEAQIRSLVRLGHSAGYIETDETLLVHRAFGLNDRSAMEIMTPMENVISVGAESTVRQAAEVVCRSTYSRYPVMDTSGRVVGVIISHDLLQALSQERGDGVITNVIRSPLVVDAGMKADDLLSLFRARRFHLAVVNRRGSAIGIVTLEDVLEELVGEIVDEKED